MLVLLSALTLITVYLLICCCIWLHDFLLPLRRGRRSLRPRPGPALAMDQLHLPLADWVWACCCLAPSATCLWVSGLLRLCLRAGSVLPLRPPHRAHPRPGRLVAALVLECAGLAARYTHTEARAAVFQWRQLCLLVPGPEPGSCTLRVHQAGFRTIGIFIVSPTSKYAHPSITCTLGWSG